MPFGTLDCVGIDMTRVHMKKHSKYLNRAPAALQYLSTSFIEPAWLLSLFKAQQSIGVRHRGTMESESATAKP